MFDVHSVLVFDEGTIASQSLAQAADRIELKTITKNDNSLSTSYDEYVVHAFEYVKNLFNDHANATVFCQIVINGDSVTAELSKGLAALLKSAQMEGRNFHGQLIKLDEPCDADALATLIRDNKRHYWEEEVEYIQGERWITRWQNITQDAEASGQLTPQQVWRDEGVYILTGGYGKLALLFANEIASYAARPHIYLLDLGTPNDEQRERIVQITALGARIKTLAVDICDRDALGSEVQHILDEHSVIHGIIHSAGVLNTSAIVDKNHSGIRKVLQPKVTGLVNLDELTCTTHLDFIVAFSSLAGAVGTPMQSEYAVANSFLDKYIEHRRVLSVKGGRYGKSLSINWPLWKQGGLQINDDLSEKVLEKSYGMLPLQNASGLNAFYRCFSLDLSQVLVIEGQQDKVQSSLLSEKRKPSQPSQAQTNEAPAKRDEGTLNTSELRTKTIVLLSEKVTEHLGVLSEDIDISCEFSEFGFDSVTLTNYCTDVGQALGIEFEPTIIFEYPSIEKLCGYLLQERLVLLQSVFGHSQDLQPSAPEVQTHDVSTQAIWSSRITAIAAEILNIQVEEIDLALEFSELGFDSVTLTQMGKQLSGQFEVDILPTVFFEYPNIASLAAYLQEAYRLSAPVSVSALGSADTATSMMSEYSRMHTLQQAQVLVQASDDVVIATKRIAVIGISGSFPMATDVVQFWDNLLQGKDCISEIPASRWDFSAMEKAGLSAVKWGGVMADVEVFDPLFFGISPREAQLMDPQQRLLMTHAWQALEDAGYAPQSLAGSDMALFIGTSNTGYSDLIGMSGASIEGYSSTGMVASVGPNRVSYLLDLHGPSEPVETACSSALVAIHRAVCTIQAGTSKMAIAGGINTLLSPAVHISFDKAGMLSQDGRCKSFSQQANGYVRGEGVGLFVLKELAMAESDGDHIYGVICASEVNHGGKANSLTAPNPKAQASLIETVYNKAGIDPRTVGYIEAHATGTELGDPVEVNGLKLAFEALYKQTQDQVSVAQEQPYHCGIGSVKSNIGHLELAAGAAGLMKVLLQLKHRTLTKTLHCDEVNDYIRLQNSPFFIVDALQPWQAITDKNGRELPRRAGLSSFGFGGVNAHLLIEEYHTKIRQQEVEQEQLILLSAKTEHALQQYVERLAQFIGEHKDTLSLSDLAYTLQVGRDAMKWRWATTATSLPELQAKLRSAAEDQLQNKDCYVGHSSQKKTIDSCDEMSSALKDAIQQWRDDKSAEQILRLWVKGENGIVWSQLNDAQQPRRISLPTYPFAQQRCWVDIDPNAASQGALTQKNNQQGGTQLHPLLHQNTSTFSQQRFTSHFSGAEFFLADHRIGGMSILPGVAYLECALAGFAAAQQVPLAELSGVSLKQVSWLRPAVAGETGLSLNVVLQPRKQEDVRFEISAADDAQQVYCRGVINMGTPTECTKIDIAALQASLPQQLSVQACYDAYSAAGLEYGAGHQGLTRLYISPERVLGQLNLPATVQGEQEAYCLHPSLLDSALQASIGLSLAAGESGGAQLPFALEQVTVYRACSQQMWVVVEQAQGGSEQLKKLNITLCDEAGQVCVKLVGFSARAFGENQAESKTKKSTSKALRPDASALASDALEERIRAWMSNEVARLLKMPERDVDVDSEFSEFGFDSISLTEFGEELNRSGSFELSPTAFFEYPTIASFSAYLAQEHGAEFSKRFADLGESHSESEKTETTVQAFENEQTMSMHEDVITRSEWLLGVNNQNVMSPVRTPSVAIIGMSGRFPGARDLSEFWENIRDAKDCISEIPTDRWDWQALADKNLSDVKWGGFMDGVDEFDALFFGISPREAQLMDPQQRLLITYTWKALEDAGYAPHSLAGSDTAIFVGTGNSGYSDLLAMSGGKIEGYTSTGLVSSVGPNRISYLLNIHGPSEPIETACSSALVAIHRAVGVIEAGLSKMALAGGINTLLSAMTHVAFDKAGMLSPDGRCKSFGQNANGYVRGEGVGMLLLKSLTEAERDGDHIYGVIRGTAVNHGGRANSLTAPNPKAQAQLLEAAMRKAGVDPRTVSYIEAHGTGTELGDPIEVNGLKTAFKHLYEDTDIFVERQQEYQDAYCALGSVKSNIGHLELAAGAAGVIKTLLQFKHKTLAASLHSEPLNPHIKLAQSPFYLVHKTQPWLALKSAQGVELPRRAGVSSFGFGGVNAHVVLEEYQPVSVAVEPQLGSVIVVLSAKTQDALLRQQQGLLDYLNQTQRNISLQDLAYTLQVGRDAMAVRWATTVSEIHELKEKLARAIDGEKLIDNVYVSGDKSSLEQYGLLNNDAEFHETILKWLSMGKNYKLAQLWAGGFKLDWRLLYGEVLPRRISLPTYPFAQQRCWVDIDPNAASQGALTQKNNQQGGTQLHPLLHQNTSTFSQQRFTSHFSGAEFFLADHRIGGMSILPGVAYLECALAGFAAAQQVPLAELSGVSLKQVSWLRPAVAGETGLSLNVVLQPRKQEDVRFEISAADDAQQVYCRGVINMGTPTECTKIDIAALQASLPQQLSVQACYDAYSAAGLEYGAGHQGLTRLYISPERVLGQLNLPATVQGEQEAYCLHPSLLDSALQASIGLSLAAGESGGAQLPFALEQVTVYRACSQQMWVVVEQAQGGSEQLKKLNITLCDEAGQVCVKLVGFSARAFKAQTTPVQANRALPSTTALTAPPENTLLLSSAMTRVLNDATQSDEVFTQSICSFLPLSLTPQNVTTQYEQHGLTQDIVSDYTACAQTVLALIQRLQKSKQETLLQVLVPSEGEYALLQGIAGMLKAAGIESPTLRAQVIAMDSSLESDVQWQVVSQAAKHPHEVSIVATEQALYGQSFSTQPFTSAKTSPWREEGVYLITGGLGGLGRLLMAKLRQSAPQSRIVLAGRSEKTADELQHLPAGVSYHALNISDEHEVQQLFADIQAQHGALHGILHCAGVLKDGLLQHKTEADLAAVFASKVAGLVALDKGSEQLALDFFVAFSSLAGVTGNRGQGDYGAANAFMDQYMAMRSKRSAGVSSSIAWPLWRDGGMSMPAAMEQKLFDYTGMRPLESEAGWQCLCEVVAQGIDKAVVFSGDTERLTQMLGSALLAPKAEMETAQTRVSEVSTAGLSEQIQHWMRSEVARLLKMSLEDVDVDSEFSEFGFDSISLTEFGEELSRDGALELSPTAFFEYPTITSFAAYLAQAHSDVFIKRFGVKTPQPEVAQDVAKAVTYEAVVEQKQEHKVVAPSNIQSQDLTAQIKNWMRTEVARLLKMSLEDVDVDSEFSEFGFDSISLTEFGEELSRDGALELSPTAFFEYPTITSFAAYLAQAHSDVFIKRFGVKAQPTAPIVVEHEISNINADEPIQTANIRQESELVGRMAWLSELSDVPTTAMSHDAPQKTNNKVAVIGISGSFPGAKDIHEFWDNLRFAKDCISEIPASRWSWQELEARGVTSMKWGGFIEGVESFDAEFFGISPLEVRLMDPQHRLLLTHVWKAIEDAGYAPNALAGTDTAIFVGTANTGYSELLTSNGLSSTSMVPSMGPARVSYLLNIHGPSEPIETACSSALVAIHRAAELLGSGKSQMAIAGGINTLLSPLVHASFDRVGMLSSDGKCKSFGQNADGYVRGEGVGMLLLKSLSLAERDGDHIYGVICGSAVNHGGRATSLTAPNPRAQSQLLEAAYKDAGVDPRTVGYIEAHGTGTDLGDPIEVNALKTAFKHLYKSTEDHAERQQDYEVPYCALGSVKSNIGHLELAAGAAAIIKTLLQVKHKTLTASLHCEQVNPHVKLDQSPFFLIKETQPWQAMKAHDGTLLPRRAGVSSFGFGGVNAHIVIEEYMPTSAPKSVQEQSHLIVLSAKSQDALNMRIKDLLHGIEHASINENRLCDVAYTLQQGREAMPYRWATVVSDYDDLADKLRSTLEQRTCFGVLRSEHKQSKEILNTLFKDEGFSTLLKDWIKQGKAHKVLELWVSGMAINWQEIHAVDGCLRVSLPSYPFEVQRYWFDELIQSPNIVSFKQSKPVVERNEQLKVLTKPRNDIERELLAIWQDLLDRQDICVLDNFFDLGGSSIQASLMVTRVKRRLKRQLDVVVLFQNPNIESLAEMLKHAHACEDDNIPALGLEQGPLSFAQVRLWLSEKIIGQSNIYNMPMTLRLSGFLNYQAMSKSMEEIVARHSILRTRFIEELGEPKQCIDSAQSWSMQLIDKQGVANEQTTEWVQQWHNQPYQLDKESGFRAALVICAENEHLLLINMHHIISDGWSMQVLNYELNALYRAKVANDPITLPELPIQYIDYAAWQHQEADNGVTKAQLYYWKNALQGMPGLLSLPLDYPRPEIQKHQGANFRFSFSEQLSTLVSQFSRQHRVTPFMSLLAVFYIHLYELTGQSDIAVGTASANRGRTELEGLIGFFVNTLVLRGQIKPEMTFDAFLAQVKSTTLSAFANQDVTFEQIVEHLNPERSMSYSPLFQVYFSYVELEQQDGEGYPTWGGGAVEDIAVEMCESQSGVIAQYDMSLSVSELETGLQGCLNYDTDLFSEQSIELMMSAYLLLVERLFSHPREPLGLGTISLSNSRKKTPLLATTTSVSDSFVSRFNAQALRTPNANALVVNGQQYRFNELDRQANQIAHYLVKQGINRSSKVGLYLKREAWLILSLMGVLKAGAAYVPLDPELPTARLQLIIEQGKLDLVICHSQPPKVSVPCMDVSGVDWDKLATTTPDVAVEPQDNAYVIFTSGSTGVPKGVMIQHAALLNFIDGLRDVVGVISAERVLLNASPVFDASVQQIVQLCLGSTLYLIDEQTRLSPQKMTEFLIENRIERMDCTPQQLKLLVQYWHATHCPTSLRTVLVGGEALDLVLWQQLNQLTEQTGCRFYNMYGPTECTVDATCAVIHEHDVPVLGEPLLNIECYILDEAMSPCDPEVVGELYLAGKSLALGYINQPELTAQRFLPNPFSNVPGERMYRTGDLVMRSAKGQLIYMGRNDHQVKIRGHRIELGEIVNATKRLEGVQDVVVVTDMQLVDAKVRAGKLAKDQQSNAAGCLIAYILPHYLADISSLESDSLRLQLKAHLMDYMIPNVFVQVESIPLTLNGKVSLADLPMPSDEQPQSDSYVKPTSVVEQQLVHLWEEVLGVKPIGINDNFFDLGGHSLLAVQLITRMQQQLPYSTDVMALFANPTVAELAQHLSQLQSKHVAVEIAAQGQLQGPLSHEQFRLWLSEKMFGNNNVYNMPITLRLQGTLNVAALERSLADIVARHSVLRTRFVEHNTQPMQVIDSSQGWSLRKINKSMESDEDVAAWTARWHQLIYKLDVEPGFRAVLVERSVSEHLLLVNMHHIVSDGWSLQLFNYELNVLYQAHVKGLQPNLPNLPIQYIDYALWQHSDVAEGKTSEQLAYWKQALTGLPTLLALPTDKPRPTIQTFNGRDFAFYFGSEHRALVEEFAQRHKVTPFMCLLAVFYVQLSLLSGQDDIGVGTASANRHKSELEGLIGFFVNTLVLRGQIQPQQSFYDLVSQVKATTAGAFANQDVTFEQIVSHLSPKRDVSHSPLFQVYFSYVGKEQAQLANDYEQPSLRVAATEIAVSSVEVENTIAQYDISLVVSDDGEGLGGTVNFNTDLFEQHTIANLAEQYGRLVKMLFTTPDEPIKRSMEAESVEFDKLHQPDMNHVTEPDTFLRAFDKQVVQNGQQIALVDGDHHETYATLKRKAEQFARGLAARGIGPDDFVGLSMPKSHRLLVALLGTLKAGAAYVPIDVKLPEKRKSLIIGDCEPKLVVVDGPEGSLNAHELAVQYEEIVKTSQQDVALPNEIKASQAMYVIYTSGSTGVPKGVVNTHGAVSAFVHSAVARYQISKDSRVMQFASISFDAAVEEIMCTWYVGGRLVLKPDEVIIDFEKLEQLCAEQEISLLDLPTSVFHNYISWKRQLNATKTHSQWLPACVETVIIGGEKAQIELVKQWRLAMPQCRLFNTYGPTEASVVATVAEIVDVNSLTDIPIGKPLNGVRVYVLDEKLNLVDDGNVGELYIAGCTLAREYLNKPEATASRWISNPFVSDSEYMYRTGDLVRKNHDGELEFIGRVDNQVKLRGYRVELGDIEAALLQDQQVLQAKVMLIDTASTPKLVAFIHTQYPQLAKIQCNEVRDNLAAILPDYMIPSRFYDIGELPLTTNGKVDTQALLSYTVSDTPDTHTCAPQDNIESRLQRVWQDLLSVEHVDIHDNFFQIGGSSLLVMDLFARIGREFGQQLSINTILSNPTIAEFSNILRQEEQKEGLASSFTLLRKGKQQKHAICLLHPIGGTLLSYAALVNNWQTSLPIYGFESPALERTNEFRFNSVESIAEHYADILLNDFVGDTVTLVGWSFGGVLSYELAKALSGTRISVESVVMLDSYYDITDLFGNENVSALVTIALDMGISYQSLIPLLVQNDSFESTTEKVFNILKEDRKVHEEFCFSSFSHHLEVVKMQNTALNNYTPKEGYSGVVKYIKASETERSEKVWQQYIENLEVTVVQGDHYSLFKPPMIENVIEILNKTFKLV